ncbi:antiviral reverse transcriptase Drt2 [Acinetobacter junii]|uniref:antiviral reverse transcriptase Drt2 n=1 Tax=Acinetobacter junii TaxID=40215 RepID=UPI003AA8B29C
MKNIDLDFFKKRNKTRNYLHFDKKVNNSIVFDYVKDVRNIEKHAFLPTISYVLNEKKIYRKNSKKNKITKNDFKGKERLINFPCHMDGNIYAYYSKILENHYERFLTEKGLENSVIAFRKISKIDFRGKKFSLCNIHFAKEVFETIDVKKNCTVLCFDISGFFDNLDHDILKENWCNLIGSDCLPLDHFKVYKSLTEFSYVEKKALYKKLDLSLNSRRLHKRLERLCDIKTFREKVRAEGLIHVNKTKKGIPQGSPLSGMLSNIYMMNFDALILSLMREVNGNYFRYCDDMIFIFDNSNDSTLNTVLKIFFEIEKINLKLNHKKTQKITFKDGVVEKTNSRGFNFPEKLQYLGVLYDGENVFLRETGLSKFHYKLRKAIRMRSAHYRKLERTNKHNNHDIYMRTLFTRFTYIGSRNYVSYVYRVANEFGSKNIKRQIKGHFNIFNNYLDQKK